MRKLLLERDRRSFGVDVLLVTGAMAEALHVPQAGGLLVKRVAKDSIGAQIGLRGGNRMGLVAGQRLIVGGDIILSIAGLTVTSTEERIKLRKSLEALQPGDDLRITILRDGKVQELRMTLPDR